MNGPPSAGALDATVRDFVPGQKLFNRYTLKRILGRGGMGVVWLANDDVLSREVALKFLPDVVFYDRGMLDDLKRETNRSLELTHKNIVRIYDFVHDENSGCISMEYVDGDTLSNIRADRPLRVFECWELGEWTKQLCEALDYAHDHARVVHRDLKPSNLMVNLRGDLKVTDFGIARSLSDSVSMLTVGKKHTSGTLVYMSPQQLDGARGSHLDDIYSLGATLYELLTSKPPFFSGNVDRQIHERKPPPMSYRREELDIVGGEPIDPIWEEVVGACLHKDPAQRPQSALEVINRLTEPAPQTTSILSGWFSSSRPVPKTEHKTAARTTRQPSTKPPTTKRSTTVSTAPARETSHIFRNSWLAVSAGVITLGGGIRTVGTTAWRSFATVVIAIGRGFAIAVGSIGHGFAAVIIGVGHGFSALGRLIASDIATLVIGVRSGLVAFGRGLTFVVIAPIKLAFRGTTIATPVLFRATRSAGTVVAKGSVVAGRGLVTGVRTLGRETVLGSAITIVPATIVATLIWFFAIRTPPAPKQVVEQKPAPTPSQASQTQASVGLIDPLVAKPAPPVVPPPPRGTLFIDSDPAGAKVIVDGTVEKTSPVSISDLPAGRHHLAIALPGYLGNERDIDVKAGEIASAKINLQRLPPTPEPSQPVVTADGLNRPPTKRAEQEQTPVVKRIVRNKPSNVNQKPPTAVRQVVAAPAEAPPAPKAVAKPPVKTDTQQRKRSEFEGSAPGG